MESQALVSGGNGVVLDSMKVMDIQMSHSDGGRGGCDTTGWLVELCIVAMGGKSNDVKVGWSSCVIWLMVEHIAQCLVLIADTWIPYVLGYIVGWRVRVKRQTTHANPATPGNNTQTLKHSTLNQHSNLPKIPGST